MRARVLKARAETPFPEALTPEQAGRVMACCRRPRERFLVIAAARQGLRIGEALGLRRCDMHLLPDSRSAGVRGAGRARARAAPGQPERGAGEVPVPAHRAGQRRGAGQLRRLPVRAGEIARRRRTATWCWSTSTTSRSARR